MSSAEEQHELRLAAGNAVKLAASLVVTWGIGLAVRFLLPRALGPAAFGAYNFADTYAASWFVLLSLGIESLIQKDAATNSQLVTRIGGAIMLVRMVLAGAVLTAALVTLTLTGRGGETTALVVYFAVGQIAIYDSSFLGAGLQAAGRVDRLSLLNVAAKALWGTWVLSCIGVGASVQLMALGFAVTELGRAFALHAIARSQLGFRVRVDLGAARAAIVSALPFYLNAMVIILANKLSVSLLSFVVRDDDELGYFSAATTLAGIALLLTPVVVGVVAPMLNRTLARSREEFYGLIGRVTTAAIQLTVPVTLALFLGADLWVWLAFGEAYAPAAKSLRSMAPMFSLTYLTILFAISLNAMGHGWKTIRISVLGIATSVAVTVLAAPRLLAALGPGGGGVGAGLGALTMELVTAAVYLLVMDRQVITRRLVTSSLGALVAAGLAVAAHSAASGLGEVTRLVLGMGVYALLALTTRAVTLGELRELLRLVRSRRGSL